MSSQSSHPSLSFFFLDLSLVSILESPDPDADADAPSAVAVAVAVAVADDGDDDADGNAEADDDDAIDLVGLESCCLDGLRLFFLLPRTSDGFGNTCLSLAFTCMYGAKKKRILG